MTRYLHFVCVLHGKKLLAKPAIKAAEKGMFAFQQPLTPAFPAVAVDTSCS